MIYWPPNDCNTGDAGAPSLGPLVHPRGADGTAAAGVAMATTSERDACDARVTRLEIGDRHVAISVRKSFAKRTQSDLLYF